MTLAFGCEEVYELTSVQEGRGAPAWSLLSQVPIIRGIPAVGAREPHARLQQSVVRRLWPPCPQAVPLLRRTFYHTLAQALRPHAPATQFRIVDTVKARYNALS